MSNSVAIVKGMPVKHWRSLCNKRGSYYLVSLISKCTGQHQVSGCALVSGVVPQAKVYVFPMLSEPPVTSSLFNLHPKHNLLKVGVPRVKVAISAVQTLATTTPSDVQRRLASSVVSETRNAGIVVKERL